MTHIKLFRTIVFNLVPILCLCAFAFLSSCKTTNMNKGFLLNRKMDSLILSYDTSVNAQSNLVRANDDSIKIYFYGEYNDTVLIIFNDVVKEKIPIISQDSLPNDFNYSGKSYSIKCQNGKGIVTLKLLRAGGYVQFPVEKKYPLCKINRINNIWYVTNRRDYEYINTYRIIR